MEPIGSTSATAALVIFIPISISLFFFMRPNKAALIVIFGGLMFLPERVALKLPLMPPLNKQILPYLSVLIGYTFRNPRRVWRLPREKWFLVATLLLIADGVGMAMTNRDMLTYGIYSTIQLPGQTIKDGMFIALDSIFRIAVPFFLGTVLVRDGVELENLLRFMVKAGLVYCPFALLEIWLSPQLHYWVYGYYQHDFSQTIRHGGYRPMVFMAHGLVVAMFFVTTMFAAAVLSRRSRRRIWGLTPKLAFAALALMLLLCKSTGAIVYAVFIAPVLLVSLAKTQWRVALFLSAIVFLYPSLRQADLFPTKGILSLSAHLGKARLQSLAYRFNNEDQLLAKARKRPWFGWGEYNRNEIFDENAKIVSVTDGEWIIDLGIMGFVGFFTAFGMLLLPVIFVGRRIRRVLETSDRLLLAGVALILAVCAIDLLPNSLGSNYTYFLAGALLSASAALAGARRPVPAVVTPPTTEGHGKLGVQCAASV